jgi:hypothetical protein
MAAPAAHAQAERAGGPTDPDPVRPAPRHRVDALVALAVGAVSLAVYVRTLLPGVGYAGDTAKWQLLGEVGGVPHATGYPLYIALDQAWVSIVPVGSLAWRVNLLSAVLGAAAVGVLYVLLRILEVRPVVAAGTALVFALSPTYWSQAVVAEVYTLHILFLVTVTACLAHWRKGGAEAWLLVGLCVYALSFGHHLTTGLALPGVVWIVWSDRRRAVTWRNAAVVGAAAVVSASQYLYLLRLNDVGGYHEGRIDTLGDVLGYVTGGDFKSSMFTFSWYELIVVRAPMVLERVAEEFLPVLVALAALGAYRGLRGRSAALRAVTVHLLSLAVCTAVYVLNYDVSDLIVFFLPLFLPLAVLLGMGLEAAIGWVLARVPDGRAVAWGVPALVAALVVTVGVANHGQASQRGTVEDAERIERALDTAGARAVLLTDGYHDSEYIWYYLLGEGRGAEDHLVLADQVTPDDVEEYFATGGGEVGVAVASAGLDGPPLYTASAGQAEDLAQRGLTVTAVATDVWRVSPAPASMSDV